MSNPHVEALRRYHELLNETGTIAVGFLAPDVQMHMFEGSPIPGPYRGHDGVRRWQADTFDVIDDWRLELDDVISGDDPGVMVAINRFVGRMKHTNLPADFPLAVVVRFRDGLIAEFDGYRERSEALAAAGIEHGSDTTRRARAWVRSCQEAVCDSIEEWEHGWIVRTPSYPRYFDLSLVHVTSDPGFTADELVDFADRALAGFGHRRVGYEPIEAGELVRPGLEALGWDATRLVWMRHERPAPPGDGPLVERVPYDAAHDLRVAWTHEDFPTLDPAGYFEEARAVSMALGVEVFAARDDGVPVAFGELARVGDSAEIASVYVHPDHRGAGLGTAITRAAIEAGSDATDLWIVADADGPARRIYERLGFREAWTVLDFLRLPSR
jgi:ribosomal protein S18 acetylase RimI-like enzyme/ketosteroid isomerase-like protein